MDQPESPSRSSRQSGSHDLSMDSPAELSPTQLCERIYASDAKAESLLVERLQPGLRLILNRATGGDWELAHDLCQEALIIVIKRLRSSSLREPSELAAFAAQTARNLAIAYRRKDSRRRTQADLDTVNLAADPARSQSEEVAVSKLGFIVQGLLDQLPSERDRSVLRRFYLHEEDKDTICHDLSLSDLAFNQVLFRARNRFRELLSGAGLKKHDLLESEPHHEQ
jgi:RNA polymerase sigma factor (sigma-70 family)